MALFSTIAGFSTFGLAARFGQLAIQKRNLFSNPGGHVISMGVWGFAGYWAYQWDIRASELLSEKKKQLLERRQSQAESTTA